MPEEQWDEHQRSIATEFASDGVTSNAVATYLHHPVLAANVLAFERYILRESTLPRDLLGLRTAWLCRSNYE